MDVADLETITAPVSDEQPCGPDLDLDYDAEFMNFAAEVDGVIPQLYFGFDPSTLPFQQYYERIGELLERTRDIRLLVPLAKLKVLQSDLGGFAEAIDAIARLLQERWADVHPQPGGFLDLRIGQLSTLDDMPNVVLPLQHAPIVRSRRAGPITLRRWQVARGEVNPRDGEEPVDAEALSSGLADADPDEVARARERLVRARDAVAAIRSICIREAGHEHAPEFERLAGALEAAIGMIDGVTAPDQADAAPRPEPQEIVGTAEAGPGTAVPMPTGPIATRQEAVEAMRAAARYFSLQEPSSPVPMLLREAEAASNKSFFELINDLVPDSASSAVIPLGNDPWFEVHISTLDARNLPPDYAADEDSDGGSDAEAATDDGAEEPDDEPEPGEMTESANEESVGQDETDIGAEETASGQQGARHGNAAPPSWAPAGTNFVANSRQEAVALLEKVRAYYRSAEPTSPVPLLVERAIDLSSRSFIELLGRVLPQGTLRERSREE